MPLFRLALALLALLPAAGAGAAPVRYDGHVIVLVTATTPEQLEALDGIGINLACRRAPGLQSVVVREDRVAEILDLGMPAVEIVDDVQALVEAERDQMARVRADRDAAFFTTFRRYGEIDTFLDDTLAINPAIATRFVVGQSLQGRDIHGMRITGPGDPSTRPVVVIQGCQHAREWATPMAVCWAIERLVADYGVDTEITTLVDAIDFHIVPVVNPDGYEYSHTTERFWRKNRRNNGDGTFGVDLNRNWAHRWGGAGSDGFTSSEIYRGTSAFSEPESAAMSAYIQGLAGTVTCIGDCSAGNKCSNVAAHLDIHTFQQVILGPWAWSTSLTPPREAELRSIQDEMASAMTAAAGATYLAGLGTDALLGIAAGVSPDWTFAELGALAWTYELRPAPGAPYTFDLPADQIDEACDEAFAGILVLANRVLGSRLAIEPLATPSAIESGVAATLEADVFSTLACGLEVQSVSLLYREAGAGAFTEVVMTPTGGVRYEASIPAQECGTALEYFYEASATDGTSVFTLPADAPATLLTADALELDTVFLDDFQGDLGWTVEDSAPLGDGSWTRGVPAGGGDRGDPAADADGSGACFVTDNADGNSDVDNGSTTLVSPILDASDPTAEVRYWRWFDNSFGANPRSKPFTVEVSDDGGSTWNVLEVVGPSGPEVSGGWFWRSFRVADIPGMTNTPQFRIRFTATDFQPESVIEAGVDGVEVVAFGCAPAPCASDVNGDGTVDIFDFSQVAASFGAGPGATLAMGDVTGDGFVDVFDFSQLAAEFGCGESP